MPIQIGKPKHETHKPKSTPLDDSVKSCNVDFVAKQGRVTGTLKSSRLNAIDSEPGTLNLKSQDPFNLKSYVLKALNLKSAMKSETRLQRLGFRP